MSRRARPSQSSNPFDAVPDSVLRAILLALPVAAKARACAVCRTWNAALADPALWEELDLSHGGGFGFGTPALVLGAVARAAGRLRVLNVEHVEVLPEVRAIVAANGATLHELTPPFLTDWCVNGLRELLASAPQLRQLSVCVHGSASELLPVLRNEPPFAVVRVTRAAIDFRAANRADALAAAAGVAAHSWLTRVDVQSIQFRDPEVIDALLGAAEQRTCDLTLTRCSFGHANIAALARVLRAGKLEHLEVRGAGFPPTDMGSGPALADAFRECSSLLELTLSEIPWDNDSHEAITAVLDAASKWPLLDVIYLDNSQPHPAFAPTVGRALGLLLAESRSRRLRCLAINNCQLGDDGMAWVLAGLASNRTLRSLECNDNNMSVGFQRDFLEPALAVLDERWGVPMTLIDHTRMRR
jgi:hypothetical protein